MAMNGRQPQLLAALIAEGVTCLPSRSDNVVDMFGPDKAVAGFRKSIDPKTLAELRLDLLDGGKPETSTEEPVLISKLEAFVWTENKASVKSLAPLCEFPLDPYRAKQKGRENGGLCGAYATLVNNSGRPICTCCARKSGLDRRPRIPHNSK